MTEKLIDFFPEEPERNREFNEDFRLVSAAYDETKQRQLKNLILDFRRILPAWNYYLALEALNLCTLTFQEQDLISQLQTSGKALTEGQAQAIARLGNAIKAKKEQLGLDPKSLAAKSGGGIAETFLDVITEAEVQPRRFVFKTIKGMKRSEAEEMIADDFKGAGSEQLKKFIETPEKAA